MAHSLYVSGVEPHNGKVIAALGIMTLVERSGQRVGFFRPIARPFRVPGQDREVIDRDVYLMRELFELPFELHEMVGLTDQQAEALAAEGKQDVAAERILEAYKKLEQQVDFVVIEGTDFLSATSSGEAELNMEVARDLRAPVALVFDGSGGDLEATHSRAVVAIDSFREKGCEVLAAIVNKVERANLEQLEQLLLPRLRDRGLPVVAAIPQEPALAMPRMDEVAAHLDGRVLYGQEFLHNKVGRFIVASGSVETMLPLLADNVLLVTHLDRHDAIFMAMLSLLSHEMPNIAGMVLSGTQELSAPVARVLAGLRGARIPIVRSPQLTYETTLALARVTAALIPSNGHEVEIARQLFESRVDTEALRSAIDLSTPQALTPKMFKYDLISRARSARRRIVLPEGDEPRILRAADALTRLRAVDLILLGDPKLLRTSAGQLGLDISRAEIIDPHDNPFSEQLAELYAELRAHKGMTLERAREALVDPPLLGTLLVHTGHADGMVAGARTSTAATIRPAFQVIKTKPGSRLVSSVFFMCLEDRVLVYGDCAVNPDPSAEQLAEIAITSAETAAAFGVEPIVAMLSYSTGDSGSGADVEKVREAVAIAKSRAPQLLLEGPLQYDAAVDPAVGRAKLPDSTVAGRATVFIFPDLNTGNNTYKAVQRSAHAIAIGPVLQGLNKPVNDLSRGCLVEDIINTVAITAIQAATEATEATEPTEATEATEPTSPTEA
jgi:phosphate acetyltransferase